MVHSMTFHKDISPWVSRIDLGTVGLIWTTHALERAAAKNVARTFVLDLKGVVEATRNENGAIVKLLVRVPRGDWHDCYVVSHVKEGQWVVVTCWRNHKTDTHRTLNRSQYEKVG